MLQQLSIIIKCDTPLTISKGSPPLCLDFLDNMKIINLVNRGLSGEIAVLIGKAPKKDRPERL